MKAQFTLLLCVISLSAFAGVAPTGRYKIVLDKMQALQAKYSQHASLFSIGDNDDGVDIMAIRVSLTPTQVDTKKVGHLIVATHHGNESAAPEFALYFLEELLKRYNSSELFRGSLTETEWTIVPVLNISGYNANKREEKFQDPNRDYPGPCFNAAGGKLKSIRRAMELLKSRTFAASLTVHGYVGALTYPWGVAVSNSHTLDHNAFDSLTGKAAQLNGYQYGTSTEIVYPVDGSFEDYAYWKHGIWSLLLELKSGSVPDIQSTSQAIAYYFDNVDLSPSVKNQLTSACTGITKPGLVRN